MNVNDVFVLDPQLKMGVDAMIHDGSESKDHTYVRCKQFAEGRVGYWAENRKLRNQAAYEVVIDYICDKLCF